MTSQAPIFNQAPVPSQDQVYDRIKNEDSTSAYSSIFLLSSR